MQNVTEVGCLNHVIIGAGYRSTRRQTGDCSASERAKFVVGDDDWSVQSDVTCIRDVVSVRDHISSVAVSRWSGALA